MKKFFILALFVLGMCNAPVFGMEHEIVLTELYSIMPLDDPDVLHLLRLRLCLGEGCIKLS